MHLHPDHWHSDHQGITRVLKDPLVIPFREPKPFRVCTNLESLPPIVRHDSSISGLSTPCLLDPSMYWFSPTIIMISARVDGLRSGIFCWARGTDPYCGAGYGRGRFVSFGLVTRSCKRPLQIRDSTSSLSSRQLLISCPTILCASSIILSSFPPARSFGLLAYERLLYH